MICDKRRNEKGKWRDEADAIWSMMSALFFAGIFVDDFVPSGGGALAFGAGVGDDGVNQVAHGVDF